ncbi:nitroreductase family deazaflavin-dependent oxidoreductase [Rhodococcus sp. P1Y]|uniref:nitroreductase family deazaflavin-dependent oxidoreductase n=1 Tax=Rhodococcus sp. P1Y TaxID=1302308 RepID=UPI000EADD832|nr:nitroreductase family deazaflavin-dependent oxidoreductase [Rhodococcus sp. P1Y]AYJ50380.1 nitroreductase family deazaflavin-dependent oxidoreductase [Rhodococcus sp. P1Y]
MTTNQSRASYSPTDTSLLNGEHVERYRATGGVVGHIWNGVTCLLLTTVGRKSGQPRETPLIYARDGDDYIVIASKGGAPQAPNWFVNLKAEPQVTVQVLAERFPARAHIAKGDERDRLWRLAAEAWPNYNVYAGRTEREIPVVVLRRTVNGENSEG